MELTREDILKMAELSKLRFTEAEVDQFAVKFGRVVDFVEQLAQVPTAGVEEMAHPLDVHTVLRQDEGQIGLLREEGLCNAPATDGEFFLVPPVMAKKS